MTKLRATSAFDVTAWEPVPNDSGDQNPQHSRVKVKKKFRGDLVGESSAELLMYVANPSDFKAGAGYVGSERVEGMLGGREGTFVLQHWGLSGGGGPDKTAGHVVPGSGTGELAGLSGVIELQLGADGSHTLLFDYDLP